jgi:hypothetical protein
VVSKWNVQLIAVFGTYGGHATRQLRHCAYHHLGNNNIGTSQKPSMSFTLRSFSSNFFNKITQLQYRASRSPIEGPCFDICLDQRPRTEFQVHFMTKRDRLTMHNTTQLCPRTTGCVVHATGIVCIVSLIAC